jgi:antitoxin VapB
MTNPLVTTRVTTRVFKSGNSQAVRIPKEFQLDVDEVEIFSRDGELVIRPKRKNLLEALDILASLPDDFMKDGREDLPPQDRNFDL